MTIGWSVDVSGSVVVAGAPYEDSGAQGVNGDQASDSATFSGAAYLFSAVGPRPPPPLNLEVTRNGDVIHFTANTVVGRNYTLEASSDLVNWIGLATLSATGENIEFSETITAGTPRRFYRAKQE